MLDTVREMFEASRYIFSIKQLKTKRKPEEIHREGTRLGSEI